MLIMPKAEKFVFETTVKYHTSPMPENLDIIKVENECEE